MEPPLGTNGSKSTLVTEVLVNKTAYLYNYGESMLLLDQHDYDLFRLIRSGTHQSKR